MRSTSADVDRVVIPGAAKSSNWTLQSSTRASTVQSLASRLTSQSLKPDGRHEGKEPFLPMVLGERTNFKTTTRTLTIQTTWLLGFTRGF
jgi:hypothetical protein